MVDVYGFHVGKYTVRPMDAMGCGLAYSKVVSTHLWSTPLKPLPTGYKGIPFIIG